MSERFTEGAAMMRWYEPRKLFRTAAKVIASAARSDQRALQALGKWQDLFARDDHDELWVDYVADTGDGFNPTYAIAKTLAEPALELEGAGEPLPGGKLLVVGGDLVYPVAERKLYKAKFELPFEKAFPKGAPERELFALPGNHDWYDGLVSFARKFCYPGRTVGSLQINQRRSYFAIKLPGNWWLLALDIQLDTDIDQSQLDYFREAVVKQFGDGDRVIICTAVPGWLEESDLEKNFRFIEKEIHETGARIHLWMAGDLHCYMRHTCEVDGVEVHKITSGGGGAFMHPTHDPTFEHGKGKGERLLDAVEPRPGKLSRQRSYPEVGPSRWMSLGNLLFFWKNPEFGVLLGALYALLGAAIAPAVVDIELSAGNAGDVLISGLEGMAGSPFATLLAALVIVGSIGFAGADSLFSWVAGALLGLAVLATAMLGAWIAGRAALGLPPETVALLPLEAIAYTLIVGGFLGLLVLGLFFTITNLAGRVLSHGFSAMRIEDYKNFVRMRVRADGSLKLYAIGIDRVPRSWTVEADGSIAPASGSIEPRLIESVEIAGPAA